MANSFLLKLLWILLSVPFFQLVQIDGTGKASALAAAAKYVPGVRWRPESIVTGDFTCAGRAQQAILGSNDREIVIAVFIHGTGERPEVLRDAVRNANSAELTSEDLDYDPEEVDRVLPGFERSKSCRGLQLSDGHTDSLHLYWNHQDRRFDGWSL